MMISVLVPTYNEEKLIGRCLESVAAQSVPPGEIVVVDNNSTDSTVRIVEDFAKQHPALPLQIVYERERQGCVAARETGWRATRGDVIVHIDADEVAPAGWMAKITKLLEERSELGAFGGAVRFENAPFSIYVIQVLYNTLYPGLVRLTKGFPYLCGGMTVVRRAVLEAMDGYRGVGKNELEDYYLSRMAHQLGVKTAYFRSLYVFHSLRRYEVGGWKAFFRWSVATLDSNYYDDVIR